jgi:hypothetical protein
MNNLEAACETFREHLASEVADELQKLQLRLNLKKGLKGFSTFNQLNDLISISEKAVITTADVDLIIKNIVRHGSPEFAKHHPAFANALEKYRVVSYLKAEAHDAGKFRQTFYHHQSVFAEALDGQTMEFLKSIKPTLLNPQDKFFPANGDHDGTVVPTKNNHTKIYRK